MSRTSLMSTGFLLIFLGIQLNIVESFTMTPRVSNFLNDNFSGNPNAIADANPVPGLRIDANRQNYNSPYYQTSYANNAPQINTTLVPQIHDRTINPPRWICWPVLFLGAVMILQGLLRP
ncbi:hypothetical protein OAG71_02375 [bacterium]|nr:hypothetical protein [bacterium]